MHHRHHWQDWVFGAIGLWLIVSPFAFAATGAALWSFIVLGALVVAMAALGLLEAGAEEWTDYGVAVLAVLLVASPWVMGFTAMTLPTWNAVLCGIVLAVAALWTHLMPHEGGHA
ncbi:SPW repeat domain-containing protein [Limimaricola pyoseonensis]|uniref:SPW repeat-containing protein n=1 Tax=Limimaricola pyoseonensis TaxID=521013 RepID=A0A1G7CS15_9RHOB|nr:SPW repeat protein [Limimaricola pyoseonensis]SDE42001.1 SPW repeat-containing protein [Limimaricola pyoseonensis]